MVFQASPVTTRKPTGTRASPLRHVASRRQLFRPASCSDRIPADPRSFILFCKSHRHALSFCLLGLRHRLPKREKRSGPTDHLPRKNPLTSEAKSQSDRLCLSTAGHWHRSPGKSNPKVREAGNNFVTKEQQERAAGPIESGGQMPQRATASRAKKKRSG